MSIQNQFESIGGQFISPIEEISDKLKNTHCFFFDWDGVFNNGVKNNDKGSPFSEPDSMGLNMLRYSYWLIHGKLPIVAIITGANNITAIDFAKRENIHAVRLNAKNKRKSVDELATSYGYSTKESLFVFDDILDLNAAKACGLSIGVKRYSSPLFNQFIENESLCSYITGSEGGNHAVRELSELLIGLNGNYNETISNRMIHIGSYEEYLIQRSAISLDLKNINN
jgi:3-deoxy-D-manno-octulosonate 8-phosphate phosphatase (KDO 8-P phosphatase)